MKRRLIGLFVTTAALAGCASAPTSTVFNVSSNDMGRLKSGTLSTYAEYGSQVKYDDKDGLYHLTVYVGGFGGCDGGAVLHAKPTLDAYMKQHNFTSYKVIKGESTFMPVRKCELFVQFNR